MGHQTPRRKPPVEFWIWLGIAAIITVFAGVALKPYPLVPPTEGPIRAGVGGASK